MKPKTKSSHSPDLARTQLPLGLYVPAKYDSCFKAVVPQWQGPGGLLRSIPTSSPPSLPQTPQEKLPLFLLVPSICQKRLRKRQESRLVYRIFQGKKIPKAAKPSTWRVAGCLSRNLNNSFQLLPHPSLIEPAFSQAPVLKQMKHDSLFNFIFFCFNYQHCNGILQSNVCSFCFLSLLLIFVFRLRCVTPEGKRV